MGTISQQLPISIGIILTGTSNRLGNTSNIRKTQMPSNTGNGIQIELFEDGMKSTREISIGNALITGGHCTKGGYYGEIYLLRETFKKGTTKDESRQTANLG